MSMKRFEMGIGRLSVVTAIAVFSVLIYFAFHPSIQSSTAEPASNSTINMQNPQGFGLMGINAEEEARRSAGCLSCHKGIEDIHNGRVRVGCTDCHGGNAEISVTSGSAPDSAPYEEAKKKAHVQPKFRDMWPTSANPERSYTLLNKEKLEFIRFVNPGDLRVANMSCGNAYCHPGEVHRVSKSMMTTGSMLWGAALYNNGSFPLKNPRFGESYGFDGIPQRVQNVPQPTPEQTRTKGILPYVDPLPRWEVMQMGNILRTFERGGRKAAEVGLPIPEEPPGRPTQNLLSPRQLGTLLRTDTVFIGLQKTRLLDPALSFLGTNDQPGDYRSSGCTACHVVYANDRDPYHSGSYAQYGHTGQSFSADATIPKNESGHPIKHQLTRAIPSSQCVVCHMHPGTLVLNTYYGYTWWDLETDGELMYPKRSFQYSPKQIQQIQERNPEAASLRGLWGDPEFLKKVRDLNPQLQRTQFADFTGHGWVFRSIFSKDRKGNLLDADGKVVEKVTSEALQRAVKESTEDPSKRQGVPVHLKDIHLEKGMHCVDCHFLQDNHGNGNLYGETRNAVEIGCVDCHGTIDKRADPTSPAAITTAAAGGTKMLDYSNTPLDQQRFFKKEGKLYQRAALDKDRVWEVVQVIDSVTPGNSHYNARAALAKTIMKDGKTWGGIPGNQSQLAHSNSNMTCFACHSSWVPSCFGCHLSMQANQKRPMLHNEGETLRNWTTYNFQTLRDDVFMLGRDGTVTGQKIAPVRSACAVQVSSRNALREWIYSQQQTVSAEGYSGTAFSTHFPHTVRTRETKGCTDCHISESKDNNAAMAMVLMQGTNFYNFLGRYVYVAEEKEGFEAVVVTEREEPQAVIGSTLHKIAFPEDYQKHVDHQGQLQEAYHHPGKEVLMVQLRGEYLYAAMGEGGLRVYDVANVDQKGFSERMVTAPVSPLGQKFYVKTKYATAVASPSTMAVDPTRQHLPVNEEAIYRSDKQPIHPLFGYLYITDKEEGLILVGAATLLDGDPTNNYLKRALTFNPDGILTGANNITIAGTFAYVTCSDKLVIVDIDDPMNPKVVGKIGPPFLKNPRAVQIQFRYAFVCDAEGVKVIDVTLPDKAHPVSGAVVPIADARNIYLVRTYAYVAAGEKGIAILDIEKPEQPRLDQVYDANGEINDVHDVKVGMTNVSLFAYVADGHNGLRVVQLTSPETNPGNYGFTPKPSPQLIATYHTHGPALFVSEGLDRDRAVDESGNQLAVFGRRGARPFNLTEMQQMYMRNGDLFIVPDIQNEEDVRKYYGTTKTSGKVADKKESQTASKLSVISIPENPAGVLCLLFMTTLLFFLKVKRSRK
jgi:hypothetical protein